MIIGHLPAGYIASRLLFGRLQSAGLRWQPVVIAGLLGAVAPDFDMLYFLFVDHGRHQHHTYLTHWPIVWGGLLLLSAAWLATGRRRGAAALAALFSLNGFIHIMLDSVAGDIWWLAPLPGRPFSLFAVQPQYHPWWLNFLLHWTFAIELGLLAWALVLWRQACRAPGRAMRRGQVAVIDRRSAPSPAATGAG
jgi:hypothetical protein